MTTGNAPTIEEQIECCRDVKEKMQRMSISDPMNDAILASLEKLAALESQPVTVEPERVKAMRSDTWCGGDVSEALRYIDSLQSAQKLAQEKYEQAVSNKQIAEAQCAELLQRAEKAEAELKLAQEERDENRRLYEAMHKDWNSAIQGKEKAEAINRRMVELMKEATDELREYLDGPCALTKSRTDTDCGCVSCTVRKAMRPLINEATK